MPGRNELITWPSRHIPDDADHAIQLAGYPPQVVVETPEQMHRRLGQAMTYCRKCQAPTYHDADGCVTCREWEDD